MRLDLNDDEARLVYADELQRLGDPRGELIVIQHRMAKDPTDREARLRELELFDLYPNELGSFWSPNELAVTWHLGFVRSAELYHSSADEHLFALMRHASSAYLEHLAIGSYYEASSEARLACLSEAGPRPTMRTFKMTAYVGTGLHRLWTLYPNLVEVVLRGRFTGVTPLDLPQLTSFDYHGDIEHAGLLDAQWPKLERLQLNLGGTSQDPAMLVALARRAPQLHDLAITHLTNGDAVCEALANAPLAGLRSLALVECELTDDAAPHLAHLTGLDRLDVRDNHNLDAGLAMLRRAHPGLWYD